MDKILDKQALWQAALGELEVILSKANFTTWFKDTSILENKDTEITVAVPNSFAKEWLEKKYHPQILETLVKLNPNIKTIKYKVTTSAPPKPDFSKVKNVVVESEAIKEQIVEKSTSTNQPFQINEKYTFENFIIGGSNRLAAATAQAVATKPGVAYNPLFLYGGVGLGKTHLVQAIANEIIIKNPKKKIIYVSCEKFTTDFIQAISSGKINDFKKKYRDADVLLVDDIQFLSGKEGTQEEFFYTFNTLHQNNRQIVITSDRVPKAIPQLEERLSSRFGWGMVADIQPPNLEMRQAILKSKCIEKNYEINDEILTYIAQNIDSNIRELEGAITRIISYCELNQIDPNMDIVTKLLEDIVALKNKNISTEKILGVVGDYFGIPSSELLSPKRNKELVGPRQIIMYLLRHEMSLSYPRIGKELNKKDHTTIIHGVNKIEKEIARNSELQKELSAIKDKLYLNK